MTDARSLEAPLLTRDEAAGYCRVGLRTFDRRVAPMWRRFALVLAASLTERISIHGSQARRLHPTPR